MTVEQIKNSVVLSKTPVRAYYAVNDNCSYRGALGFLEVVDDFLCFTPDVLTSQLPEDVYSIEVLPRDIHAPNIGHYNWL